MAKIKSAGDIYFLRYSWYSYLGGIITEICQKHKTNLSRKGESEMINIGQRREVFFDDYLIDTDKTTAEIRIHRPVRQKEIVMTMDAPCEFRSMSYFHIVKGTSCYQAYYVCRGNTGPYHICYAESDDCMSWRKPKLGICEYEGSKDNNIIIMSKHPIEELTAFDNIKVMYDENPACPANEKYKATLAWCGHKTLAYLLSEDGIHWRWGGVVTTEGEFDSHNLAIWDRHNERYLAYFRDEHLPDETVPFMDKSFVPKKIQMFYDPERGMYKPPAKEDEEGVYFSRDIAIVESKDFKTWTHARKMTFGPETPDYQLYTNAVMPYPRADHIFVGFPTRYIERKAWTPTYDELCGKEKRKERIIRQEPREGLALTDCAFMVSRDGYLFKRYDEAFMIPNPENPSSWVYGDCYPAPYLLETASDIEGADNEFSIFMSEADKVEQVKIYRHTIRLDGFVSRHAGGEEKILITKPFIFEGDKLFVNLETSARGSAYFTLRGEDGETFESYEIFGNSVNKRIHFTDDNIKILAGKPVVLEIKLHDADIYSLKFEA